MPPPPPATRTTCCCSFPWVSRWLPSHSGRIRLIPLFCPSGVPSDILYTTVRWAAVPQSAALQQRSHVAYGLALPKLPCDQFNFQFSKEFHCCQRRCGSVVTRKCLIPQAATDTTDNPRPAHGQPTAPTPLSCLWSAHRWCG